MLYFEKLIVWQKAMELATVLVKISNTLPQKYQFSFADQLRRASLSIPSNIAEGSGRKTQRDSANFYSISKGSLYESINILILLKNLDLLDNDNFDLDKIRQDSEEVVKMLHGLSKVSL